MSVKGQVMSMKNYSENPHAANFFNLIKFIAIILTLSWTHLIVFN